MVRLELQDVLLHSLYGMDSFQYHQECHFSYCIGVELSYILSQSFCLMKSFLLKRDEKDRAVECLLLIPI
jgi:hypothetical protein